MFAVFLSIVQVALIVNALVRSIRDRFVIGAIAGVARLAFVVGSGIGAVLLVIHAATPERPIAPALALDFLVSMILGPLVSFAALTFAHLRQRNVPAAQEERLGRVFTAWFPVALFDAAFVLINAVGWYFANRD